MISEIYFIVVYILFNISTTVCKILNICYYVRRRLRGSFAGALTGLAGAAAECDAGP